MIEEKTVDINEIIDAKNTVEKRAGMVKVSDVGYTDTSNKEPQPIHDYKNKQKCECNCHPNKIDCMNCYDHPEHLKKNKQNEEKS